MTQIIDNFKVIGTQRHQLAEGPFWCDRNRALYWVDIPACEIWRWNAATETTLH